MIELSRLAKETVKILERGFYQPSEGPEVSFGDEIDQCLDGTAYFEPEALNEMQGRILASPGRGAAARIEVVNETSLSGALRALNDYTCNKVGVLNFASATSPGGGFLTGSPAQEESLARTTALYPSLMTCPAYYDFHRQQK